MRGQVNRSPGLGVVEQGAQHIHRLQQQIDKGGIGDSRATAQFVEQRLDHVGEFANGLEAKGARTALDRMRGPEDRVDGFRIQRGRLQREQTGLHDIQTFGALGEEGLLKLAHVDTHDADLLACFSSARD